MAWPQRSWAAMSSSLRLAAGVRTSPPSVVLIVASEKVGEASSRLGEGCSVWVGRGDSLLVVVDVGWSKSGFARE